MNSGLREVLMAMVDAEAVARQILTQGRRYEGYPEALEALHIQHAEALLRIVTEYGWPGKSLVEKSGATAAFMLARNAISIPELQKLFLRCLEEAVLLDEVPAVQAACLQDCILFYQGHPQQCGMFFDWNESKELIVNVKDISQANARRKSLGLNTLEEDLRLHKHKIQHEGGGAPQNIQEHKRQELAWAKRVGWRTT